VQVMAARRDIDWGRISSQMPWVSYFSPANCRSELAREKLKGSALILDTRVIVFVFREQARSYRAGASCF
ncbi:hypothetical protein, partial [Pseudomonas sp. GL93]|uniref:hypothetical protein n=1 Tax=Pseudomonas sp. GL93 TaxID=2014741 RepID=UPI001C498224